MLDASNDRRAAAMTPVARRSQSWWIWVAILVPYIALLWLPLYNDRQPALLGFPFFYWYQFVWVPLTALLLYFVYRRIR
jgi:bacteriorhodopsin